MTGILIATHHNLAEAFCETVEMIAGKHDFVESVGLRAGQDPEAFGQLIADKVEQFHQRGHEEVVVMLDLFGGTPCNPDDPAFAHVFAAGSGRASICR